MGKMHVIFFEKEPIYSPLREITLLERIILESKSEMCKISLLFCVLFIVRGTTDVKVVTNSTKPKSFDESSYDCSQSNSRLPDISVMYPLYRLPPEIQMSDSGPQWFGTLDDALKDSK